MNDNIINNGSKGMVPCTAHKCYACEKRFDLVSRDTEWTCPATQQRYKIRGYSCNHRFVVYVVYCTKCNKYYIGSTLGQLRKRLREHKCGTIDVATGEYYTKRSKQQNDEPNPINNKYRHNDNNNDAAMPLYQHFNNSCIGTQSTPIFNKHGKQVYNKDGPVLKHESLCHMKCFIIDTVNPKTIYKFLIGAISYKRVLHELYKLEMKYQGETLSFMHGLNTYVDWNATNGLRRGDGVNVRPDLNISFNDYDNIYGLDRYITRDEFEQLIRKRSADLDD